MMSKKWGVYGFFPDSVGKIEGCIDNFLFIRYSKEQMYPVESWDSKFVRKFTTPEEAIAYVVTYSSENQTDVVRIFTQNFPDAGSVDEKKILKHIDSFNARKKK